MRFNNKIKMQDLFQNSSLENILPQFNKDDKLQNVQSFEWVNKKVADYLKNALGAKCEGDSLVVEGKKLNIIREINNLKYTMEAYFNCLPSIAKNIRKNTKVYLPFSSIEQIKSLKTPEQKAMLLNAVLDNVNYNPDFQDMNNKNIDIYASGVSYEKRQAAWADRVGYYKGKL